MASVWNLNIPKGKRAAFNKATRYLLDAVAGKPSNLHKFVNGKKAKK